MGKLRWNTICGSGLRREAEPSLGEVPAHVGPRDAAAAEMLEWESCACRSCGKRLHGLREVPDLRTVEVMAGERARGGCQLDQTFQEFPRSSRKYYQFEMSKMINLKKVANKLARVT